MLRMTPRMKKILVAVGAAAVLTPAVASADPIDDALDRIPPGQISCEDAEAYWTTEEEYNSLRSQALAVAPFHPRGAEIRDALARVDEAATRCGLKGGGGTQAQAPAPAPAPGQPAPAPSNLINLGVSPGMPYVDVPVADIATVRIPDALKIMEQATAGSSAASSNF